MSPTPAQTAEPALAVGMTTGELARRLDAELRGSPDVRIARVDGLERADANTLSFIRDSRHAVAWERSGAGAAIVSRSVDLQPGVGRALLVVDDADFAMMGLLEALTPPTHVPDAGVHRAAHIAPDARVHPDARIGPGVVVGPRTVVGARAILHPNVALGADVRIGDDAELRAGVVIEDRCAVGRRTRIHANAVIGADGFGYRPSPDGGRLIKIPHAGHVEIGDDVEIGANTTIDRGKFGPTVISDGAKIDNLVQIGHNCRVGRSCIICGACALAGSVTVGDGAVLAGGVGVADNLTIGARARVGARSGVMDDVPPGESWVGTPAMPARTTMKILAALHRLPDVLRRLRIDGDAGGAQ